MGKCLGCPRAGFLHAHSPRDCVSCERKESSKKNLILIVLLFLVSGVCFLSVGAAPGAFTFRSPDFALAPVGAGGYVYLKENCSYNSLTMGSLVNFANLYWDSTGITWGSVGIISDGGEMNVTTVNEMQLVYNTNIGDTGRVWQPGQGTPQSVTNAWWTYDSTSHITTITATGSPVTLTWVAALSSVTSYVEMAYRSITMLGVVFIVLGGVATLASLRGGDPANAATIMLLLGMLGLVAVIIINAVAGAL